MHITSSWKPRSLIALHLLILLAVASLFLEPFSALWRPLDLFCFKLCNQWIAKSFFWQNFWAMANHRLADWLEDFIFLVFFVFLIVKSPRGQRIRKAAECLFILLLGTFIILLANEVLFRVLLDVRRNSPSIVVDTCTNLSEKVTWLKVKVKSPKSFPGDHGTTALLSIAGFFFLSKRHRIIRCLSCFYGFFLCLPRLVVGAHWMTDVLIGGGSIITFFFSWAFCTPFAKLCISRLETWLRSLFSSLRTAS